MNHAFTVTWRTSTCGLRPTGSICSLLQQYGVSQMHHLASPTERAAQEQSLQRSPRWPKPQILHVRSLVFGYKTRPSPGSPLQNFTKACFSASSRGNQKTRTPNSTTPKQYQPKVRPGQLHANKRVSSQQDLTESLKLADGQLDRNALKEFSQDDIAKIFGPTISQELGNDLLHALHLQRIMGTLDQKLPGPRFDDHLIANGLAWLRTNYPVDEDAAIIKRIEEEESRADEELVARAEKIGLYRPQQDAEKTGMYGKSGLDAIRKHHEDQPIKSQAQEIRNAAGDTAVLQTPTGRAVLARRSESAEWIKRYKEKALISKASEPAKLSPLRRLFPSALFCIFVVGASILFAQNYVPPPRQARLWPDTPPAAATVMTIIAMNVAVLMTWRLVPPMWGFLNRYFLMIAGWPRPVSLLGNCFSHQYVPHLAGNMITLWFVGTQVHDDIGRAQFLAIFLSSGVVASFFSLSSFVLRNNLAVSSLGCSGAITGLIAALCYLHSGEDFKIAFLPEEISPRLSANAILITLIGLEIFSIARGWGRIDHWAHLGGYMTGLSGAYIIKLKQQKHKDAEVERRRKIGLGEEVSSEVKETQLRT